MSLKKRSRYAYFFIAPFFIAYLVFSLYPQLYSLWMSVNDVDALSGKMTYVGAANFKRLVESSYFAESIWNTFVIWIVGIIPQLTIAFLLALFLNNKWFKGRSVLRNIYYFPNLVTPVTIGLLFSALFLYPGGSINQILGLLNIDPIDFNNNIPLARAVISLAIAWKNFGFNIIYFTAGLHSISNDVYEAAEVDGCTGFQKTLRITLPLLRPMLIYVLITSVIGGLQMFDESKMVFKGSVPNNATTTMVKYLYDSAFDRFQFGYGAAVSVGVFVVVLIASLIVFALTSEKIKDKLSSLLRRKKKGGAK